VTDPDAIMSPFNTIGRFIQFIGQSGMLKKGVQSQCCGLSLSLSNLHTTHVLFSFIFFVMIVHSNFQLSYATALQGGLLVVPALGEVAFCGSFSFSTFESRDHIQRSLASSRGRVSVKLFTAS